MKDIESGKPHTAPQTLAKEDKLTAAVSEGGVCTTSPDTL